jgi:uncharacterized protein (DUF1684 family)
MPDQSSTGSKHPAVGGHPERAPDGPDRAGGDDASPTIPATAERRGGERDPVAVALGRRGGLKGGRARAEQLSPEERRAIAQRAAQARWAPRVAEQETAGPAGPGGSSAVSEPDQGSQPSPEARPPWAPRTVGRDAAVTRRRPMAADGLQPRGPWAYGPVERSPDERAAAGVDLPISIGSRSELIEIPGREAPLQLLLADWRRRVSDLYAEIRQVARTEPERAWHRWRDVRELLYRQHPMSPVPEDRREAFRAAHFAYDPALRFELAVRPDPFALGHEPPGQSREVILPNSGSETLSFDRVGSIDIPLSRGVARLSLFWLTGYGGGLFLPFRDATNGTETYGGGRYLLDTAKGADLGGGAAPGTVVIDFNFAYQPSCAFDPRWACPLPPPENRVAQPIHGGEHL